MGINFNTRVAEAVACIIVYAYLMAWVLFLIPVMCGSRSGEGGACPKIAWVLILIPMTCGRVLLR